MQLSYRGNVYNYRSLVVEPVFDSATAGRYRGVSCQINPGTQLTHTSPVAFKYRGISYIKAAKTDKRDIFWNIEKLSTP